MSLRKTPNRGSGKPHQRSIAVAVSQGQVGFRLLCSIYSAGGVIGHSGSIVKRLERETSARIQVEEAVSPASKERLVHVVGSVTVDRMLQFQEEDQSVDVSAAQEGLIRVFERVLEVEPPPEGGVVRCRLLVTRGMAGAVIGGGGKRINKLTKDTGAFVKILPSELLPPCADSSDELVQITGGSLAVKKAVLAVSRYLQEKASQLVRANGSSSSSVMHPSMDMDMNDLKISDTVNREATAEVVFKLLCPFDAAGAVIGWKGRKIKALEDETGASICFSAPEAGCKERVITVSAIESEESANSSAQNALLRVFNESTSSDRRRAVTARLLIQPNQADWLNVGVVSNISAVQKATGTKLQILKDNCALFGAPTDQRIIQIDGEHSSVLLALFQVSWRLRGNMVGKDNPPLLPHKLFNLHPGVDETAALTDKMNKLNFLPSQFSNGHHLPTTMGSPRDLATNNGGFALGSGNKSVVVTNTKVEIVVHKGLFGSVYGDDGSNLTRLRTVIILYQGLFSWGWVNTYRNTYGWPAGCIWMFTTANIAKLLLSCCFNIDLGFCSSNKSSSIKGRMFFDPFDCVPLILLKACLRWLSFILLTLKCIIEYSFHNILSQLHLLIEIYIFIAIWNHGRVTLTVTTLY